MKPIKPDLELPEYLRPCHPLCFSAVRSSSYETENWPKYFPLSTQSQLLNELC